MARNQEPPGPRRRPGGREILQGVNLSIDTGEVHAIMGKNGSGKSTLCQVLAGRETYEVTGGTVHYEGKDLLDMSTEERGPRGRVPRVPVPGRDPRRQHRLLPQGRRQRHAQHRGQEELDAMDFLKLFKENSESLEINDTFTRRAVNEGFSGGEKSRNEVFQMAVMNPKLALLDETDSGLDIDALKTVANGINKLHELQDKDRARSCS